AARLAAAKGLAIQVAASLARGSSRTCAPGRRVLPPWAGSPCGARPSSSCGVHRRACAPTPWRTGRASRRAPEPLPAVPLAAPPGTSWALALGLLAEAARARLSPAVRSCTAVAGACTEGRAWRLALGLMAEVAADRRLDAIACNAAIAACEKGSRWQQALMLRLQMTELGLPPDVITFNSTISACEKGQQWSRALSAFSEMQREARVFPARSPQPSSARQRRPNGGPLPSACWRSRAGGASSSTPSSSMRRSVRAVARDSGSGRWPVRLAWQP
ncbi:unnamed protein product, partial [Prorocentrum cordatum]